MTNERGGEDSGLHDLHAVGLVVSAVDATSGQVDDNIRAIYFLEPISRVPSVPRDGRPGRRLDMTSHGDNVESTSVEVARQNLSELSAPAGDDDAHEVRLRVPPGYDPRAVDAERRLP